MTTTDEAAELAEFNELMRSTPLHAHMDLQCLQHGPHTVMTMDLGDSVRGFAPGSVHGGMLATLADIASAMTLGSAFDRCGNPGDDRHAHSLLPTAPRWPAHCRSKPGASWP
jgi:acyl-coenzyme A thioesterase PaaI-like protein